MIYENILNLSQGHRGLNPDDLYIRMGFKVLFK
ncbi:MAG: hypothetical protein RLZZ628_2407 [Bacteroidota bacterium]|jgi:hypothetical protein